MIVSISLPGFILHGQGKDYEGPDDPAGDIAAERDGYMTGNRIRLFFRNTSELSDWPLEDASLWPNTFEGTRTLDGIGLLVGARVYVEQGNIPVEDPLNYSGGYPLDTLYYCQTSYRQKMDVSPIDGFVEWGFYPAFGYFNELSEHPAMSNRPNSWPTAGWPSTGDATKWPGEWDGRFGRGITYADLETYFVVNDAQDLENLIFGASVQYFPRPGVEIGDKKPDVTIQAGEPWGGIGIRVEQRGFQWNNPQARNAIFWEYEIANISDYNLPEVVFGYWVDTWIGGENDSDDLGFFDVQIDMAYCWDQDGVGLGGRVPGTLGFAYLESPGIISNFEDDDNDGLTDEQRDNDAVNFIGPTDGITDLDKFLEFYNLSEDDLVSHWDADEDQDWDDGIDLNGDGNYYDLAEDGTYYLDPGEDPGDDVGLDGVGPGELNYFGPDEGEGNHMPDYAQGIGCEPDFNATDVSESDMVGLTSFQMFNIPNENSDDRWPAGDESMWELLGEHNLEEWSGGLSNLILTFASGPFQLFKGREERISMAELHSYDPLSGLNGPDHSAPALYEQKRIVQIIYEKDYRFAQPPMMPTLTATAEDGRVILTWDDVADTRTRDPFMGNINDFEGYKLYKATDKLFSDALQITDGHGVPSSLNPILQCDIIDGRQEYAEYGHASGSLYYLGAETGIVHHYIDTEVQNGRTYYYALVAYDYGDINLGISPSENNIVIELDSVEDVRFAGKNVQIVTPRQDALGYVAPSTEIEDSDNILGTGKVTPSILARGDINEEHRYMVTFDINSTYNVPGYSNGLLYTTSKLFVHDVTGGDTVQVYSETPEDHVEGNIMVDDTLNYYYFNDDRSWTTDVFDGLRLELETFDRFSQIDMDNSGWLVGDSPMEIWTTPEETQYFPWDYEIVFTDNDSAYVSQVGFTIPIQDEFGENRLSNLLRYQSFPFYVVNKSFQDENGDYELLDLVVQDLDIGEDGEGVYNPLYDRVFVGPLKSNNFWAGTVFILDFRAAQSEADLPEPGDVYKITFRRPFFSSDSLYFDVIPESKESDNVIASGLKDVKVVPNPYIGTNSMEQSFLNTNLNQDRRLMFTNIPAKCEITIFSASAVLVDKIIVDNPPADGIVHWDLVSKEGLDIAAGIYLYVLKTETGDIHKGKFAVIK